MAGSRGRRHSAVVSAAWLAKWVVRSSAAARTGGRNLARLRAEYSFRSGGDGTTWSSRAAGAVSERRRGPSAGDVFDSVVSAVGQDRGKALSGRRPFREGPDLGGHRDGRNADHCRRFHAEGR